MVRKLTEEEYVRIRKNIIKKLYAHKAYQKGHLLYERLASSIPPHLKGHVSYVLDELIHEGLILCYGKTKHGEAYQLNIAQLKEIEQIVFDLREER